jgi:ketosteroid isomerase-like protein
MLRNTLIALSLLFVCSQAVHTQDRDFLAFLTKLDAAQLELQNGKGQAFKGLWSRSDDVTLSGGFGGTIEKGWDSVSKRLDWVEKQFSNGTNKIERLVTWSNKDLGYVVQLEHIRFKVPGQDTESTKDYRVTMIFRKEKGDWRLVHRQADSNLTKQAPK